MNNKMMPVLLLGGAFAMFIIWRNPAVAGQDMSDLVGGVGTLVQEAVSKIADFVGSLGS
jgi:16S rRNA G966 N2-methylase RsmD